MSAHVNIVGTVATEPKLFRFENGGSKCTFRIAESERRLDRAKSAWVEGETSWYAVNTFRTMAENAMKSLQKGQRIVVSGRLRQREWQRADGTKAVTVEVDADGLGHDLRFGSSTFEKTAARQSDSDGTESSFGDSVSQASWVQDATGVQSEEAATETPQPELVNS